MRNNYTGGVGFEFTVGTSSINLTQLGLWVVSGNSTPTTIRLLNSSCVQLGSTTINPSGAPAGYMYGVVGAPITLTAGASYFALADTANAGDQWCEGNTIVTTTAVATVVSAAYDHTACSLTFTGTYSYGPVDFKYQ